MSRTTAASTRKRKPALGLDPLTWIREDEAPTPAVVAASIAAPPAGGGVVVLDAELGIGDAPVMYERLAAALADDGPLRLDGTGVETIDGAALQLLAVFCREACARGRRLEWVGVSARLADTVRVTGLAGPLGLAVAAA